MNDPRNITTGAYIACGEMADGQLFVSVEGVGLRRLTAAARELGATVGDWRLLAVTGTLEAVTAPSEATAIAFHRDGWALALQAAAVVDPETASGGYVGDEVSYGGQSAPERIELWQYAEGAWTLAAAGTAVPGGAEWEIIVDGADVYLVRVGGGTAAQVYARRGAGLAALTNWYPHTVWERTRLGACANGAIVGRTGAGWWRGRWWTIRSMDGQPTVCSAQSGRVWGVVPAGHGTEGAIGVSAAACGAGSVQFGGSYVYHYSGQQAVTAGVWGFWDNVRWQWADLGDAIYMERLTAGQRPLETATAGARVWGVGEGGGAPRLWLIEQHLQGVLIYAREQDGVEGLQVTGTGDPAVDGWYRPDGDGHWVRDDGGYEIIQDGDVWVIVPVGGTAEDAIYTSGGSGGELGIVVIGADDPSVDGHYSYSGEDAGGHGTWTQDDGEHRIIWDDEQGCWVIFDGDGTIIYRDGSGPEPWMGLWETPTGGAGPVVGGQMELTDGALAPAGMVYEWIIEDDDREIAYEARIKFDADRTVVSGLHCLVRCDREDAAADDWRTYQLLPVGRAVELDRPGHFVRVAVFRPAATEMPACQLVSKRFRD